MSENDLRHASEIADARLGVAENLGWYIAIFFAAALAQKWSWWIGLLGGALMYVAATHGYRKKSRQAEDAYFKAAGLGKYADPS